MAKRSDHKVSGDTGDSEPSEGSRLRQAPSGPKSCSITSTSEWDSSVPHTHQRKPDCWARKGPGGSGDPPCRPALRGRGRAPLVMAGQNRRHAGWGLRQSCVFTVFEALCRSFHFMWEANYFS